MAAPVHAELHEGLEHAIDGMFREPTAFILHADLDGGVGSMGAQDDGGRLVAELDCVSDQLERTDRTSRASPGKTSPGSASITMCWFLLVALGWRLVEACQ